jgi:peptide/nickel transport system permease protein
MQNVQVHAVVAERPVEEEVRAFAVAAPSAAATVAMGAVAASERGESYWWLVWTRFRRNRLALGAACVAVLIAALAVAAPLVAPYDPVVGNIGERLQPLGAPGHILGTDEQGRDILSRILYGGRVSIPVGILPVAIATLLGGALGVIAGFAGGRTNLWIMRGTDVFYAFPAVMLAIAVSCALGAGVSNSIIAVTLVFIPPLCRVAEAATRRVCTQEYVEIARAEGASGWEIIRCHVLGNILAPVFAYASSLLGVSIILVSGLSFLGLGVAPPQAEWGFMLSSLRDSIYTNPWVSIVPGAMIFLTSMVLNLTSDGLREAMDVRL